jgi:cysteine-S-conjugate beta-lyase
MKPSTQCVYIDEDDRYGAISPPIYQTATFRQSSPTEFGEFDYSRTANPTRSQIERQIAALERGRDCSAFASGMAAITALVRQLKTGDHIVAGSDLYGGTVRLLGQIVARQGISVSYVDTTDMDAVLTAVSADTKLILVETPSNPLLQITDIAALSAIARRNNAWLAVDNSMLSPCFQRPLELGADVVIHSATKFLCGHSDVTGGALVTNDAELAARLAFQQNAEGGGLGPFDSWLLLRGMKTLALRVERQNATAHIIAEYLSRHSAVESVYYPGLMAHRGHHIHRKQACGDGAVLSFTTGSAPFSERLARSTGLFKIAVSFGSVNSVISLPQRMSHASIPQDLQGSLAPPRDLVRISVGIEDPGDLIDDLERAFNLAARDFGPPETVGVAQDTKGRKG